jgi:hypothetical protein
MRFKNCGVLNFLSLCHIYRWANQLSLDHQSFKQYLARGWNLHLGDRLGSKLATLCFRLLSVQDRRHGEKCPVFQEKSSVGGNKGLRVAPF